MAHYRNGLNTPVKASLQAEVARIHVLQGIAFHTLRLADVQQWLGRQLGSCCPSYREPSKGCKSHLIDDPTPPA